MSCGLDHLGFPIGTKMIALSGHSYEMDIHAMLCSTYFFCVFRDEEF